METSVGVELSTMVRSPEDAWDDEELGRTGETEELLGDGRLGSSQHGVGDDVMLLEMASNKQQLKAILHRQWLFKKRAWSQTSMELLSPILMMSLLVLGWCLSTPVHYDTAIFAELPVPLMESFDQVASDANELLRVCPAAQLLRQQITQEELQAIVTQLQKEYIRRSGKPSTMSNNRTITDTMNQLLPGQQPIPPDLLVLVLQCLSSAQDTFTTLSLLGHYNGALPIPNFDTFVAMHKLIKSALVAAGRENVNFDDVVRTQKKLGNMLGNLLELGLITFAPNTSEVAALVNHMNSTHKSFADYYGGTFPSEGDAISAALSDLENQLWAVVVVDRLDPLNGEVSYKIRMNFTTVPRTWRITHKHRHGLIRYYKHYYTSGFLSLQDAINSFVFQNLSTPKKAAIYSEHPVWGVPFPVSEYTHNKFYDAVGPLMGLLMCLCTLYPLAMLVKALVEEKETRTKETMLIMGLRPWIFNTAWLITYMIEFLVISFSVALLLSSTFFPNSDSSLIFVLFFLFTSSLIPFGFFLSVFFSRSKLAAIVAPFVHFATIMPRYVFFRASSGQAIPGKSAAALLPSTAFTFGIDMFGQYEGANSGLTWRNFMDEEFSLAYILLLLMRDFVLYSVLAWYLGQIIPSEFGAHLAPWFPFTRSYWCGDSKTVHGSNYEMLSSEVENGLQQEVPGSEGIPAVQVRGLMKVYPGGKVAVDGLDLDIFEGQITGLLGHNGAGKSTTISMLTGLVRATSGQAKIWGYDISGSMKYIRRMIGVCPQQNVLFEHLTVVEHLKLFAAIKGVPERLLASAVQEIVRKVELTDKCYTLASNLSGGMKRKLQVGIAMVGESKVVFLDEPTSGMDPHARRGMWKLLRAFKRGRAVVLTTHYMDEADVLCDRIAIMSEGRLRCCGSSLFLKAKYGVGYQLTMTKDSPACDTAALQGFVHRHLPQAIPLSFAGGEITFQLPVECKSAFPDFFLQLEQQKDNLLIGSFGVSMTTLEEVFIRLATEGDMDHKEASGTKVDASPKDEESRLEAPSTFMIPIKKQVTEKDLSSAVEDRVARSANFKRAWLQLFKKRIIIARRDLKGVLNSVLLPVAVIAFVMLILKLNIDPAGPKLQLTFDIYKSSQSDQKVPVFVAGSNASSLSLLVNGSCMELQPRPGVGNSLGMSMDLLFPPHDPAKYGALVFNDTVLGLYNFSALSRLNSSAILPSSASSVPPAWIPDLRNDVPASLITPGGSGRGLLVPLTILHNTSSDHVLPVFIQELAQARLRATLDRPSAYLKAYNQPLPLTKDEAMQIQTVLTILAALFVLIPFCYLAATFAVFVVRERALKAKLLQMVSGASSYTYWCATYSWDMVNYVAIVAITLVVFVLYRDEAFIGTWPKAFAVTSLLIAFGFSVVPLSYVYSFWFSNHANAQVAIAGIHFVTGFVMVVASIVMEALDETRALNAVLVHGYRFFPPFNLGRGLLSLSALDLEASVLGGKPDPFKWNIIGQPLFFMCIEAFGYFILTLLIDSDALSRALVYLKECLSPAKLHLRTFTPGEHPVAEDVDVSNERKRVEGCLGKKDEVTMRRLWKVYPGNSLEAGKVAVKDLSLGISAGECFGFLGVNGAGKTTTLSMLTGDIKPTSGNAFINGYSVLTDLPIVQQQIGYCPQFDPLLDLMTAREHLHMYAILKGVPDKSVNAVVDEMVEAVGLQKYADSVAGSYSGGNKRKLSLAIALIGDPAVVFLDEPGSGMDPVARRAMWDLIVKAVSQRNVAMVLTTHSMEECEALCNRIGVMVAGSLVCLGPIQHIKSRFGEGYTVEMHYKAAGASRLIDQFMISNFPGAELVEQHSERLRYRLPSAGAPVSRIFGAIEREKDRMGIDDYSVSQSTLEQVFLSFARRTNG